MNDKLMHAFNELDPITNLYRRDVVFTKVKKLLDLQYPNGPVVILVELHRFKQINDGIGPEIGDKLIQSFAKRLSRAAPDKSIIGRMGGDGFAIILRTDEKLDETIDLIYEIAHRPFSLKGNIIIVDCSMGISIGHQHGNDAHQLIRAADIALHNADKVQVFNESMLTNAKSLHLMENDLRYSIVLEKPELLKALTSNQFDIYYQPQIEVSSGNVSGVEALLRWNHPERGYVKSDEFISLAEEIGVINLLGTWVLKKACKDIQKLRKSSNLKNLTLSVNVSPKQLEKMPEFLSQLGQALEESKLPPKALILEITENIILETSISEIKKILDFGCSLALDDFGTGYASMNVLRSLPLESAKLDKVFVINLFEGENKVKEKDNQVIKAFMGMCNALDIETTIEGVEKEEQALYFSKIGCSKLQGYHFSRPLPLSDLEDYLDKK